MELMVYFFITFVLLSAFLPLLKNEHWSIRMFDFVRFQMLVISLATMLIGFVFLETNFTNIFLLTILFIAIIMHADHVFPYTKMAVKEVKKAKYMKPENEISIFVANIYMYNNKYMELVNLIEKVDPDIFLLLEVNDLWDQSIHPHFKHYQYRVRYPLENTYGMVLYSKKELFDTELRFLTEDEVPSIFTKVRLNNDIDIDFYGIHPKPPVPSEANDSLQRDVELLKIAKEVKHKKTPSIVAGDLNDVAWSYTTRLFQKISRLLDPRKGRGFYSTYNANVKFFRWPLDHIFHSREFNLVHIDRLEHIGSDHFPIYSILSFEEESDNNEPEKLNDKDIKEIDRKLELIKA